MIDIEELDDDDLTRLREVLTRRAGTSAGATGEREATGSRVVETCTGPDDVSSR
jgi:hypothetical protein